MWGIRIHVFGRCRLSWVVWMVDGRYIEICMYI